MLVIEVEKRVTNRWMPYRYIIPQVERPLMTPSTWTNELGDQRTVIVVLQQKSVTR